MIILFIIATCINCFIFCSTQYEHKHIVFPFHKTTHVYSNFTYAIVTSNISIGTPPEYIKVSFSSQLYLSFIFDKEYNGNGFSALTSKTFSSKDENIVSLTFREFFHYVKFSYDLIRIPNERSSYDIVTLPFYFDLTYNNFDCNGGIIGVNIGKDKVSPNKKEMNSLLNVLYKEQLVSYETISVDYNKEVIVFGKDIKEYKGKLKIKCNCNESKWMCMIHNFNGISTLDTQTDANNVLFMFESEFSICPERYFDYIREVYLKHEFKEQICKVELTESNQQYYIICNHNININKLPPITFEFNNKTNTLSLSPQELFTKKDSNYIFLFRYHINIKHWIFGCSFLTSTNTTIHYDVHNKHIHIFNNEAPSSKDEHTIILLLIKLTTYINIISLMLLLIYLYLNHTIKFK